MNLKRIILVGKAKEVKNILTCLVDANTILEDYIKKHNNMDVKLYHLEANNEFLGQ